eukprot:7934019-Karenia_brevis.AAC.1
MQFAVDENGRIFIDRSGKLFEHVLQFLRCCTRPAQKVIDACGEDLLIECEFYGVDWLMQHLRGDISPCDLRPEDREMKRQEEEARTQQGQPQQRFLMDVHSADMRHRPRAELQLPLLFDNEEPNPKLLRDLNQFVTYLNSWSGGLIEDLRAVPGLVYAGGAVLAALVGCAAGDLDIFVVGGEEPERRLRDVFAAVQRNQASKLGNMNSRILVTRSKNAVTFFRVARGKPMEPPVQVVTTLYDSIAELLT